MSNNCKTYYFSFKDGELTYYFSFEDGELVVNKPIYAGFYVTAEDYESLQAKLTEAERWDEVESRENERLQAEVDRLTASLQKAMTIIEHDGLAEPTEKDDG
jgi:hypothetical protein